MTKIALVVGSLRRDSLNRQLATRIATELMRHAEVSWLAYVDLPPMNQDLEWPVPEVVARVRAEVGEVDGLWIVSPEYNGSYPAHLKNLIDWLSRPTDPSSADPAATAINTKKVTVSGVGGSGATAGMRAKLVELLERVGADVMAMPSVGLALSKDAFVSDALVLGDHDLEAIREQVDAFYAYVTNAPASPTVDDMTSVPNEPSEGGVFTRTEEIGSCSAQGCSVDRADT